MTKFSLSFKDMEKDSFEKYVELLKEAGWQVEIKGSGGPDKMVVGKKDNLELTFVHSTEDGSGLLVVITAKKD